MSTFGTGTFGGGTFGGADGADPTTPVAEFDIGLALSAEQPTLTAFDGDVFLVDLDLQASQPTPMDKGDYYVMPFYIDNEGSMGLDFTDATVENGEPELPEDADEATYWFEWASPSLPGVLTIDVDADHYVDVFQDPYVPRPGGFDRLPITALERVLLPAEVEDPVEPGDFPDDINNYAADVPLVPSEEEVEPEPPEPEPEPRKWITDDTVELSVARDSFLLIRVTSRDGRLPMTFTWSWAERLPQMTLRVLNNLSRTPGSILAEVGNVNPMQQVTLTINGETVAVAQADEGGTIARIKVPVEQTLQPGTYELRGTTNTPHLGVAQFMVLETPDVVPVPLPAYPEPEPPLPTQKWQVQIAAVPAFSVTLYAQPAKPARTFVFPINPDEATSPYAPQAFTLDSTTNPAGITLTWEGAPVASEWSVRGWLIGQTWYEQMEALVASELRYWLIDHHRRMFLVTFEGFDPVQKRAPSLPGPDDQWAWRYTLNMLVWDIREADAL